MHIGMSMLGALLGGAVFALSLPAPLARAEEPARPRLTGRWQLNKELSEDARAKMEAVRDQGGDRGRPPGGAGGGMGGPGRGMGGRPGGTSGGRPGGMSGERPGGREGGPGGMRMQALLDPPTILTITGNDAELTFDAGDDVLVRYHLDGKKYKQEGGSFEVKAAWKGAELVIETKPTEGSGRVTSTCGLLLESGRLQIVTTLEGPRGGDPISVKRVYDPAPLE
jgi:hypothetical protein